MDLAFKKPWLLQLATLSQDKSPTCPWYHQGHPNSNIFWFAIKRMLFCVYHVLRSSPAACYSPSYQHYLAQIAGSKPASPTILLEIYYFYFSFEDILLTG